MLDAKLSEDIAMYLDGAVKRAESGFIDDYLLKLRLTDFGTRYRTTTASK